jgi:lysophospholipase L1-like esterase
MSRVDIVCDTNGVEMWVDHHKHASCIWESIAVRSISSAFALNSNSTSNGGTYTWRDLVITKNRMVIPKSTRGLRVVHFYGDSYQQQAAYPPRSGGTQQQSAADRGIEVGNPTPDGKTGTGYNGSTSNADAGAFASMRRVLAQNGFFCGTISMWGQGGSGFTVVGADLVNKIQDRVTSALLLERPDVAVFMDGYNDAKTNGGAGPADLPAYRALVQTCVNSVLAKNPNAIIVLCALPYSPGAAYLPTLASTIALNAERKAVADATPQVTYDDKFTQWGGASTPASYFAADEIHPSPDGSQDYGRTAANIVMSRLLN